VTLFLSCVLFKEKTNEIVEPQSGFTIVATSNTKGNGDNADMFAGAQIMNQAFIERFAIFLNQQYPDAKTETQILSKLFDDEVNKPFIQKLIKVAKATREVMDEGQVEHCLTTRRLAQIVENYNIFRKGYDNDQDERLAFEMAVNRFDKITADAFIQMYNSLTIEPIQIPRSNRYYENF
jgi:MoxR-like ATPase